MNRDRLLNCIRDGQIMHAVLFTGPEGSGRSALARDAASMYLFGALTPARLENAPDYMELNAPYTVDLIRTMIESMAAQAFSNITRRLLGERVPILKIKNRRFRQSCIHRRRLFFCCHGFIPKKSSTSPTW